MSAREEFIEIFKASIHRDGADALLDFLENRSDFFPPPPRPNFMGRMPAARASTA